MLRVLFICTGNTCRSPMAEAMLRAKAAESPISDSLLVLSAGTSAWEGNPASGGALAAMREINIDLTSHRSRRVAADYIQAADIILTMTQGHRRSVIAAFPGAADKIFTLAEFAGSDQDIDDPYGGDIAEYRNCREQIRLLIDLVWEKLVERAGKSRDAEKEN